MTGYHARKYTFSTWNLRIQAVPAHCLSFEVACRRCVTASLLDGNKWYKMQVARAPPLPPHASFIVALSLVLICICILFFGLLKPFYFRHFEPQIRQLAVAFGIKQIMAGTAVVVCECCIYLSRNGQHDHHFVPRPVCLLWLAHPTFYSVLFVDSRFGAEDRQALKTFITSCACAFTCCCGSASGFCPSGSEVE